MDAFYLKIIVDIPCEFFIDSEFKGIVRKDSLTKIPLNKGEYQLLLRSTVNHNYSIEEFIFIEYDRLLKYSFRERFASRQYLVQDSDIRMTFTEEGYRFRDIALGLDLPGEFSVEPYMYYSDNVSIEEMTRFHEGLAAVQNKSHGNQYFIDTKGSAIAEGYSELSEFHEGIAGVSDGGKWGFVDKTGRLIIDLQFEMVGQFNDGLAVVQHNDKMGYINKNGEIVVPCNYRLCWDFQNGYALVELNDRIGLINRWGMFVIPAEYDSIMPSANPNVYIIHIGNKEGAFLVPGGVIFPCQYDYIDINKSNSKVACAGMNNEHFFFNDGRTTTLESDRYTKRYSFFSNSVLQRSEEGTEKPYFNRMCLCNLRGEPITKYYDFNKGYVVNKGWNWSNGGVFGFVNDDGEESIPCIFQNARNFTEGLAAVNKGGSFLREDGDAYFTGGKWGYINRSGDEVIPFQYDDAGSFYGGAALVRIGKYFFYIDKYGNEL